MNPLPCLRSLTSPVTRLRFARRLAAALLLALTAIGPANAQPAAAGAANSTTPAKGKTVRLFTVGNSFSQNAMRFLPDLATAAGHTLVLKTANLGGCSLERHWTIAEKAEANPQDPAGRIYGKSLRELLESGTWDFVTIQQYSFISNDTATYRPYARNLHDYIKKHAPAAEVLMHETWAYRDDDPRFRDPKLPYTKKQMYDELSRAYRTIAGELGIRVIPVGDAFFRADTDPQWGYKADPNFDPKSATQPNLPVQEHSLHVGWRWIKDAKTGVTKLSIDGHHANENGCYLAGCVWLEFLFGESAVGNKFLPKGMTAETAAYLQKVAHETVRESAKAVPASPKP